MRRAQHAERDIWQAVDRLIDRAPGLIELEAHRLHLLAARRWRALGRAVPRELREAAHGAGIMALAAPIVLERALAAYDRPIVLMKGLEVAARYPDPALRPFRDLDLLVADAAAAQRALISAGFEGIGKADSYYADKHHLRPLYLPGLPLRVEVHSRPGWPAWAAPPPTEELLSAAVAASVGVDGVLTLAPSHHALVVAAHSWSEVPLRRALDLVDVAVLSAGQDRRELRRLAQRWGLGGVWDATDAAVQALLFEARTPWTMRIWARELLSIRDRTVFENHLRRLAANFWVLPLRQAVPMSARALVHEVRPFAGEAWQVKLVRIRRSVANPFSPLQEHNEALERRAGAIMSPGRRIQP
jgi:Uncharacterised nucleotidyltransferase